MNREPDQQVYNPVDHIETWIDRGERPGIIGMLRGEKGTGDVVHIEFSSGYTGKTEWICAYAEGRRKFQGHYAELARKFATDNRPAKAVIACDIALGIPNASRPYFNDQGTVLRAVEDQLPPLNHKPRDGMEPIAKMMQAMNFAFGTPFELHEELSQLLATNSKAIEPHLEAALSSAVDEFIDSDDFLAAGVGAAKLADFYKKSGDIDKSVLTYGAAGSLLQKAIGKIEPNLAVNTAHWGTISSYRGNTAYAVVEELQGKKVQGQQKDILEDAANYIYSTGWMSDRLLGAYKALKKSSSWRDRKKFKPAIKNIKDAIRPPDFIVGGDM